MRLAFLALGLVLPTASSALPAAPAAVPHRLHSGAAMPSRFCRDDMKIRPVRSPRSGSPRRLGDLPSGDLTLTVLNRVGDCIEPATVRQGYGGLGGR